ncbi:hypothetical protein BJV82DRAFT_621833 [Fennellomyces sp. T-0311]|nr:hypothetical protein BJV82DRAFT_621833 [Fennellomyces sp. T-0311]
MPFLTFAAAAAVVVVALALPEELAILAASTSAPHRSRADLFARGSLQRLMQLGKHCLRSWIVRVLGKIAQDLLEFVETIFNRFNVTFWRTALFRGIIVAAFQTKSLTIATNRAEPVAFYFLATAQIARATHSLSFCSIVGGLTT